MVVNRPFQCYIWAGKEITNDPSLHALARSMRATFSRDDMWSHLSAMERVEYLGYALIQRDWLRQYGFVLAVTGPRSARPAPCSRSVYRASSSGTEIEVPRIRARPATVHELKGATTRSRLPPRSASTQTELSRQRSCAHGLVAERVSNSEQPRAASGERRQQKLVSRPEAARRSAGSGWVRPCPSATPLRSSSTMSIRISEVCLPLAAQSYHDSWPATHATAGLLTSPLMETDRRWRSRSVLARAKRFRLSSNY
jgi:hypothetical protein